jgi:two-component system OmpR family sensor kinase
MARRIPKPGFRGKLALAIVVVVALTIGLAFFAVYRSTESELRAAAEEDLVFKAGNIERELLNMAPAEASAYQREAQEIASDLPVEAESIVIAITIDGVLATNRPEAFVATGPLAPSPSSAGGGSSVTPSEPDPVRVAEIAADRIEAEEGGRAEVTGFEREDDHGATWEVEVTDDGGSEYDVFVDRDGTVVRIEEKGGRSGGDREEESDELEYERRFLEAPEGFSEQKLEDFGKTLELTETVSLPGAGEATVRVAKSLKPTEEALEGLGGTFLRLGIVALLISAALAWLLASRLTRPLRRLTELSQEVAEDDLTVRVPLDEAGSDEVRTLAISFNQMLDRLEDSFDRQKAFVADASHDLRTPITIVRGQIEVLARNPNPSREEVDRVAASVGDAVRRMERLVDDLLILARSESRGELEVERQAVGPLLEAEREGRLDSERERIEIGAVTDVEVEFDRDAISRAVSNLVDNALRYSGPEGRVVLSAASRDSGVEISVEDDGPGIPLADRERVFDRFARLDRARSSDTGGSGLGLAIVRTLVESGGGRVSCTDSALGGARFSIYLPAR